MPGKLWTKEEELLVKEYIELGNTHKEIIEFIYEDFGIVRTIPAIKSMCIKNKWKSKSKVTTIKDLYKYIKDIEIIGKYVSSKSKIECKCNKCFNIWYSTPNMLQQGKGCPICAERHKTRNRTKSHSTFIEEMKSKPVIVLGNYINSRTHIEVKCTICNNIWHTAPDTALRYSCPACTIDPTYPKYTYFIYFPSLDLYKVGITNNIKNRQESFGIKSEIIFYRYFKNGQDAYKLEQQWLSNIEHLKINTGKLRSGNTETFKHGNTTS